MNKSPARYWRENKKWSSLIGKRGVVVGSTQIRTAAPTLQQWVPYSYVIVEIEGKRYEFTSIAQECLLLGDIVECVLRKTQVTEQQDVLFYGIKVKKIIII